ncbi:hypothetical protein Tco_0877317 [Tanacetum coccineum]|uniref:Helitron helicase-like domain-containing protein n=1 Tax=Tanacetum coccineum TaxID=301880 RepID=A0ABQ5BV03_9ASTR
MAEHFTTSRASSSRNQHSNLMGVNGEVDGSDVNVRFPPSLWCSVLVRGKGMCPEENVQPHFLQLCIFYTNNEVANRMRHFGREDGDGLKRDIVAELIEFLDNNIALVNDYVAGLYDAVMRGDIDGSDVGLRIILPQSFTGGPRLMSTGLRSSCVWSFPELMDADRPDIVDRVIERKFHIQSNSKSDVFRIVIRAFGFQKQ